MIEESTVAQVLSVWRPESLLANLPGLPQVDCQFVPVVMTCQEGEQVSIEGLGRLEQGDASDWVYLLRLVRWLDQEAGDCRLSRLDIQVVVARRGFLLDQAMPFVRSCCSARVNHDTPDVRAEDCLLVILGQLQRRDSHLDFYVESVGLSPAYQAKGIMTRLFLRICRWLYQCDSDSVLSGIPEHIAAARFYEPKKSLSCGPSGRLAVSQLSCFALPIAQVLKRHRQKSACLA